MKPKMNPGRQEDRQGWTMRQPTGQLIAAAA